MGFAATPLRCCRRKEDQKLEAESGQQKASPNPLLSLLNALGFLGSGVLAALYASLLKEKVAADATIESLNVKLKEKAAAFTSLEKAFESVLLNEKETRNKALAKEKIYEKRGLQAQLKEKLTL